MARVGPRNHRAVMRQRIIGALLIMVGISAATLTVAIYWTTTPAFAHHNCHNRFNTDGELGAPLGHSDLDPAFRYTLIPFQLICEWEQVDGSETRNTHIELGTPVPVTSLVTFTGGLVLLLTSIRRPKE